MRPEIVEAERREAVRSAARSWRKAGWIGEAAEAEIAAAYADDRQRHGPALRTLLFLLTWFAISSGFGVFGMVLSVIDAPALLLFLSGAVCIVLAELAYGKLKLLDYGPESALSWCGVGSILGSVAWLLLEGGKPDEKLGLLMTLAVAALVFGLGAWRWGSWLMATVAGLAVLGILAGLPLGRISWIAAGLVGGLLSLRAAERVEFGPSQRRCLRALLLVSLAAVALALFPRSNEDNWIEKLGLRAEDTSPIPLFVAWLGSVVFAAGLFGFAIRTRRRLLLDVAALYAVAMVLLVLEQWDVQPYWAVLCGGGLGLIGGALLIRRFLDGGPDHERSGFSSAALLEDAESRRLLEAAAVIALATPEARDLPSSNAPGLEGKGGAFGGGGSSAEF